MRYGLLRNKIIVLHSVPCRPPRLRCAVFPSIYLPHLLSISSDSYWASVCLATLPDIPSLICDFCSSDQRFAIRLPSDSTSRWTPLPLAVSFPLSGHFTDFHRLDYARSDFRTVVFGLYPIQFYFSVKDITLSQGFPSSKTVHRTVFEFTSCGALVQECFAVCGRRLRGTFMRKSPLEPRKRTGKLPVPTLNAETIIQTVRVVLLTERFGCCIHVLTIAAVRQ